MKQKPETYCTWYNMSLLRLTLSMVRCQLKKARGPGQLNYASRTFFLFPPLKELCHLTPDSSIRARHWPLFRCLWTVVVSRPSTARELKERGAAPGQLLSESLAIFELMK